MTGLPEVKNATGKRAPPANVAFGGTLTATRPRAPGGTLGVSQPGSPARIRPRQVSLCLHCSSWQRMIASMMFCPQLI